MSSFHEEFHRNTLPIDLSRSQEFVGSIYDRWLPVNNVKKEEISKELVTNISEFAEIDSPVAFMPQYLCMKGIDSSQANLRLALIAQQQEKYFKEVETPLSFSKSLPEIFDISPISFFYSFAPGKKDTFNVDLYLLQSPDGINVNSTWAHVNRLFSDVNKHLRKYCYPPMPLYSNERH